MVKATKVPIIPLKDLVLVKQLDVTEMTPGGLYKPAISEKFNHMAKGVVVATGKGWYLQSGQLVPPEVKKGDIVLYQKMQTNEYRDDEGNTFYLLPQANLLAIIPIDK